MDDLKLNQLRKEFQTVGFIYDPHKNRIIIEIVCIFGDQLEHWFEIYLDSGELKFLESIGSKEDQDFADEIHKRILEIYKNE